MADEEKSPDDETPERDAEARDRGARAKGKRSEENGHDAPDNASSDDDAHDDDDGDGEAGDEQDAKPPIYKRPLFWIVLIVATIVLVVGGILFWLHKRQFVSTDDAFVDAHIVRLAPEVSGRLVSLAPADNRHVEPGQLLAVIEPSGPQAQLAEARAGILQAQAGIRQAEAKVVTALAQRAQAASDAVAPAADAARAARDYARYLALVALDPAAAARTQVDAARASAESTAAQARAARHQVETQDANVAAARRDVDAALAQREAAQARVQQAQVTIGNLRLVAPVAGQVVSRNVNLGSYVAPGQQIMAIVPDAIWVTANFKETQLVRMRKGQHVDIHVDAFPDVPFEGHVDSIQRGAGQAFGILPPQNATGNFVKVVQRVPVRILFDRPDPRRWPIGPGMSVVPTVKVR